MNKSGHVVSKRPGLQVLNTSRTKRLLENLTMVPMVANKTTKRGYNDTVFLASDLVSDQASTKPKKKAIGTCQSRNVLKSTENLQDTFWSHQQSAHNDSLYVSNKASSSVNISTYLNTSKPNSKSKTARNGSNNLLLLNTIVTIALLTQNSQVTNSLILTARSNETVRKST